MAETKQQKIDNLTEENDHLASLCKAKENSKEYAERELNRARRMFMDLYEEKRTLDLRFQWLEEAASETITSCADHRDGAMIRLADELGLEYTPF